MTVEKKPPPKSGDTSYPTVRTLRGRWKTICIQEVEEAGAIERNVTLEVLDPDGSLSSLKCEAVSQVELKVDSPIGDFIYDVSDIRDRQWDGLNYYVSDIEGDVISFYCRAFTATRT